jgi:uncharacterized protein (TIGR02118 family)
MIRVSILYPKTENSTFDMDYYCNKHIPMTEEKLGAVLKGVSVEAGLSAGLADSQPPYAAMGHLLFDSLEAFVDAFTPHAEILQGDIPNYTNVKPVFQISEVKISR